MLKYLKIKYPKQIEINFFKTPNLTSWKTFLPQRVNEIVGIENKLNYKGVQHIKAYIFDDDILISGFDYEIH
jgi:CDP-diacylglycerol---glycerol-3-phosphate 3-phosphatidyltransferase